MNHMDNQDIKNPLKKSFTVLFGFQAFLLFLSTLLILFLYINQINLAKNRESHFNSYLLADELRQSSDDLTRFVRAYVATGDKQFEDYYYAVANIRNGIIPRPEKYNQIYWDFYVAKGSNPTADGPKASLEELMIKEGFTAEELNKLNQAKRNSDELIKREMMAFNAVKGLYLDEAGNFTVQGQPNIAWANELVNGSEYYRIKAGIMQPIDEFYNLFQKRITSDISLHLKISNWLFLISIVASFLILSLSFYAFFKTRRQIEEKELAETEILKLNSNLEGRVLERTILYEEKSKDLEKNQKAILNILEDVEVEKDRSEKLASDLEKFKLAVDFSSNHIVITDPEGIILYGNNAATKITGFKLEQMLGKKAGNKELWGGKMSVEFYQKLWKTIKEEKKPFSGLLDNVRANGEKYTAEASIAPVLDTQGEVKFFVGIERDVTKEQEVDRAKTEFVSLASHQLRTPLSSINWYTEMLLDGDAGKLTKAQKEYLNEVYVANQRMVSLVNSLLNVSRLELGTFVIEPELLDIREISDSVILEMKPRIEDKKLQVTNKYDSDIGKTMLDPNLTRIIFQNLISNAVKYTPEKGKVRISITKETKDIKITVSDTGMGIPKAQQDKVFDRLFRADNVRKSAVEETGLGMYIIKSILDTVGGAVWFESEENVGTNFYVTIPLAGMVKKEGTKKLDQ